MRRRTRIRETARRPKGKRTRLFPLIGAPMTALIVGLTSLACRAQQNRLPNTPAPPPTLNLAASKDLPLPVDLLPVSGNLPDLSRTAEESLPDAPTPNIEPAAAASDGTADPIDTNNDSGAIAGNLYASASADNEAPQQ